MTKYARTPEVPVALLTHLKEVFPDRLPVAPVTPVQLAELVGQQQVIRLLTRYYEDQNNI